MAEPEFWVEARTAIKSGRVMEYGVWHININNSARECVQYFSTTRKGGAAVALYLANMLRDDLNSRIK